MHIQKIELENYGPFYGRHEFVFEDRGLTLIMGDNQDEPRMNSNGAGKSSILDGLDFCLFGKIPRQDHVDSIVNDEAKACYVTVYLLDDLGRNVVVRRKRSTTTTLELFIFGELQQALDVSETQKRVEEILGVDRDVFHAAVLFAQTDLTHYAESSDTERMNILTKILQLEEIDQYLEGAKDAERKSRYMLDSLVSKIDAKQQILVNIAQKSFEANIADFEEDRQNRIASIQQLREANIEERKKCLHERGQHSEAEQAQLARLRAELVALPVPYESALREYQNRGKGLEVELNIMGSQYKTKVDELTAWRRKGVGICLECGQVVSAELLNVEIQKRENELTDLHEKMTVKNNDLSAVTLAISREQDAYNQAMTGYNVEIQNRNYEIGMLEQRIAGGIENAKRLDALNLEFRRLDRLNLEIANEINPWVRQREENEQAYRQVGLELETLTAQRLEVLEDAEYITFWVNAFGPKGLKSYILDARLQELTDSINQWVTVLTGGTIWIQFASQKKTRSKKLVNSPAIRVCRWNPDGTTTERNFNSWSGGEKQRISFAIDFGLSRLIAKRAKKTYNLLILDEVFRHLDQGGKEAVMEMLQLLAQEKSSVFVVEHDTDFQSAFENRILVQKKNGRSTIKELGYGQGEIETGTVGTKLFSQQTQKQDSLHVATVSSKAIQRTPF